MVGHNKEPAFDKKAISVEANAIPGNQISRDASPNISPSETKVKVPWYAYIWDYDPGRTKEETAFVQRLDFCVLTILGLGTSPSPLSKASLHTDSQFKATSSRTSTKQTYPTPTSRA